jgi:TIR domain
MAGKIFINYRRDDSIGMAGRLHDRLAQTFGRDKLFIDVDHIPVGVDFAEHLNSQAAACDAILVVIGPHWLDAKDESGDRRLDKPDDFVAMRSRRHSPATFVSSPFWSMGHICRRRASCRIP